MTASCCLQEKPNAQSLLPTSVPLKRKQSWIACALLLPAARKGAVAPLGACLHIAPVSGTFIAATTIATAAVAATAMAWKQPVATAAAASRLLVCVLLLLLLENRLCKRTAAAGDGMTMMMVMTQSLPLPPARHITVRHICATTHTPRLTEPCFATETAEHTAVEAPDYEGSDLAV